MTVKLLQTDSELLETAGTIINVGGQKWYYLPFWYKKISDDVYEQVSFEKLPQSVKDFIQSGREENNQP